MTAKSQLDETLYPPFAGFPPEAMKFFLRLKRNNHRTWFQGHRDEYDEFVRFPMQCLIASLGSRMREVAPEFQFHPTRSIFRIYRDVRFSKDKSPYKTNIAASFSIRGRKDPTGAPGLYVGIEPGEIFIGGGLYMPSGPQLKSIRASIAGRPEEYLEIVRDAKFRRMFKEVLGDRLSRAPLGYPPDHPMIEHLKLKQFYVGKTLGDEVCRSPRFADTVASVLTGCLPLVRWLDRAVTGGPGK
jgi:uncharacterized protein (TIGR02453 family)